MKSALVSPQEAASMIKAGKRLILAGDESVLMELPTGHWIGGTIPYFMAGDGGVTTRKMVYVNELPSFAGQVVVRTYNESTIESIYTDAPDNGFSVVIIPASSPIHMSFAINAPSYRGFATRPLIGWIAGTHLQDVGREKAKVFFGENLKIFDNRAVAMHITLPDDKYADIGIINLFTQGEGDIITFPADGFTASNAFVNDEEINFADYIIEHDIDIRFPLVADYSGAMINTSFQGIDGDKGVVSFYAPVFMGIQYRLAKPVYDYMEEFTLRMKNAQEDQGTVFFSCNCILNYLYSELEGKSTGALTGPVTFGEIAYQLLNQTLAYVTIQDR